MIKKCEICGREFKTCKSRVILGYGRFCSSKCWGEYQKERIEKKCIICGKVFYAKRSEIKRGKKYCSLKCYHESQKTGTWVICKYCGKKFYAAKKAIERNDAGKYCSWKCFRKVQEIKPNKIKIKCDYCGKEIYRWRRSIKRNDLHFCSRRCLGCYTIAHQNNPSSLERKLAGYLIDHNISFICQFKYKLGVADFFIKPNLIIEVDGDYWHNLPKMIERDKRQTLFLEGEGYTVLRLWEHELNKNPDICIEKILELI